MTFYLATTVILALLGAAGWLWWRSYRSGKTAEKLRNLDAGIQGLDHARKAVDDVRRDPDARDRLRDKYRR